MNLLSKPSTVNYWGVFFKFCSFYFNLSDQTIDTFFQISSHIYVIHQTGGPYWEKLCPRSWIPPEDQNSQTKFKEISNL